MEAAYKADPTPLWRDARRKEEGPEKPEEGGAGEEEAPDPTPPRRDARREKEGLEEPEEEGAGEEEVEEEGEPLVKREVQKVGSKSEKRQKEEQQLMRKKTMTYSPPKSKSDSSSGPSRGLKVAKKELRIVRHGVGQAHRQAQGAQRIQ